MKRTILLAVSLLVSLHACKSGNSHLDKEIGVSGPLKILAIGDSNGAIEGGWVDQLRVLRPEDSILNTCVSGNTIGFDNLGRQSLNTLRSLDGYLNRADSVLKGLDRVIIILGTNDCKAVFADSTSLVPGNFETLLEKIEKHTVYLKYKPQLLIVSPPPMDVDSKLIPKYQGGRERVLGLNPVFKAIAEGRAYLYLDIQDDLLPGFDSLTTDGVHFNVTGQMIIAGEIDRVL